MAPYAVAHLKLGMQLQETGYRFGSDQRLGIYLTNTLEEAAKKSEHLIASWVAEEANAAAEIKRDKPIMVVLGNPPYSGISANRGQWITRLLADYRSVDGQPLGEKKVWLKNDYVKFLRFGQWRIEQTGHGVLGVHHRPQLSWTARPFAACAGICRKRLMIFTSSICTAMPNAAKPPPMAASDENVFDITQGWLSPCS